jgi:aspartate ammonia-lyase
VSGATRVEKDPLGALDVPAGALYGVQTLRAVQNFPISGQRPLPMFVTAVVWIKKAAALTHKRTKRLDAKLADAIVKAADEVLAGKHREDFVVDPYQAGAGTSHNMNANEVLANRANEMLGAARGVYAPVHPNDHVNMAQSTNDVIPTAIRLGALVLARRGAPSTASSRAAARTCRTRCRSGWARSSARTAAPWSAIAGASSARATTSATSASAAPRSARE